MSLASKLKKAYPKLKKGLASKFDSCIIGVDANKERYVYCQNLLAEKLVEEGVTIKEENKSVTYDEACEYIWWCMTDPNRYVIVDLHYQGGE